MLLSASRSAASATPSFVPITSASAGTRMSEPPRPAAAETVKAAEAASRTNMISRGKSGNLAISSQDTEKPEPRACVLESATRRGCDSRSSSHL